ncbi:peptide deformylase [Vogesella sp. LIG4]|uniref:peptide deformylase n=1 Tax=Vogesella sp. LIG4 TaxID=1192162 RepID=UPI00081FEB4E|nr:peptide deformylase [Vogesella sp. LIG4]SCK07922.1 peptide deformylase [Vogesella sp. LIG4]
MPVRPIVSLADPCLRQPARPVGDIAAVLPLLADLADTLYASRNAVGLSAPQLGISLAVTVLDVSDNRDAPLVLINPQLLDSSGYDVNTEGCLSLPGVRGKVGRANRITLRAQGADGSWQQIKAADFLAVAIQHELDHLAGRVFIDHLPRWRQRWLYWRHPQWLRPR